jgi:N-acetylmuramoyl-L-alanine amidase
MPTRHIVRPGDCMTSIGAHYARDPDRLWNASENADLRALRDDPNVLFPGDIVVIPDASSTAPSVSQGQSNRYRARVPLCRLAVELRAPTGDGLSGIQYRLSVDGRPTKEGVTGSDGLVEAQVPATAVEADLEVWHGTPHAFHWTLAVGHLDPVSEESGVAGRLENLGYHAHVDPDDPAGALRRAVSAFQRDHGLGETGVIDDATRDALVLHAGG